MIDYKNGLFIGHGLHYGQDFSGGERMDEKLTWLSTWQHFLLRESSKGQVLGQYHPSYKKLGLHKTPG